MSLCVHFVEFPDEVLIVLIQFLPLVLLQHHIIAIVSVVAVAQTGIT